ncbi:transposase IS66 [Scytonema sp. HK-05]|nr:transposase IS66 [Scytonema sp. HK-05]
MSHLSIPPDLNPYLQTADWAGDMVPGQDIGVRLQAFLGWINNYGHLPYEKQQEMLWELGGVEIGVGTLVATNERVQQAIKASITLVKQLVKADTTQRSRG